MDLAAIVRKYLEVAGAFDCPVHLSRLGLSKDDTEKIISSLDQDYQISRYLVLSRAPDETLSSIQDDIRVYRINDFEVSHLTFHPDIRKML